MDAHLEFSRTSRELRNLPQDRYLSYRAYNAYSRFLFHLFEFYMGAIRRDLGDTSFPDKKKYPGDLADRYVQAEARRILEKLREQRIRHWISEEADAAIEFPDEVQDTFSKDWRSVRNKAEGHVLPARASLSLSAFYRQHHSVIFLLYYEARSWWGRMGSDFPDLGEVTSFSTVLLTRSNP